ncbi:MAG: hypothetical protein IJV06_07730 [Bacteroidaceae bacterium]|nr:hypothetical protein [Bacteroidaceae bacterium]
MMFRNTYNFLFLAIICIAFAACNGNKTKSSESQSSESDDFVEQETYYNDTIEGEKVSQDCAAMSYNLDDIISRLEAVKSPSMLMKVKADYPDLLTGATAELSQLPTDEKALMQDKVGRIRTLYTETCRAYEVEADGIISNLQNLIQQIQRVNSKAAFDNYCSGRYGMLKNLDKIHLSTNDKSPHIKEIKRLAHQLNSLVEAKKAELGMED